MVEWSRSGRSSISATWVSSSRNDQRARPGGGAEQASAINRASTSPVTIAGTGGSSRGLRPIVASTSPRVATNRFATTRTVFAATPDPVRDHRLIGDRAGVLVQLQQHPGPPDHPRRRVPVLTSLVRFRTIQIRQPNA